MPALWTNPASWSELHGEDLGSRRTATAGSAAVVHRQLPGRAARVHSPCAHSIARADLRERRSSTVSTVPMTTTYLYTGRSTVELHPSRPLWNTTRRGRIRATPDSRPRPSATSSPRRTPHREVPRRPRRARGCRRLGGTQPAGPSQRPGPGRAADRGQPRGAGALDLRLRDLGAGHAPGRGRRRGPGAGQRPAARRHLPQPAGQAGRDDHRRRPGLADLWFGPVQPADHAGRGLPDPARRCRPRPAPCRARRSRTRWPRPSPPPAATTCSRAHRRPHRDRRLDDLAAGHRPVPALPPRARLEPAHPRRHPGRAGAGQGAR